MMKDDGEETFGTQLEVEVGSQGLHLVEQYLITFIHKGVFFP